MLMKTDDSSTKTPLVWVLQTKRAGDSAQARALADELGWPFKLINLQFNSLYNIPNSWLGATLTSVEGKAKPQLTPPWPDLVIAVARRTVPVARWVKAQTGGKARLVHLGRPRLTPGHFDLVISTPQYSVQDADNVLQLPVPLHAQAPSADTSDLLEAFTHLPRPWTAVLVGGEAWPYSLGGRAAQDLARDAKALTGGTGSIIVCTSPRTPDGFSQNVVSQLDQPAEVADWQKGTANPYPALLETADRFIVTGDSASMLAEACSREKPVHIFELPKSTLAAPVNMAGAALAGLGVLHPPRDMSRIHKALVGGGHAATLRDEASHGYTHKPLTGQLQLAAARVRSLFF